MIHSGLIESNECPSYLLRVLAKHADPFLTRKDLSEDEKDNIRQAEGW